MKNNKKKSNTWFIIVGILLILIAVIYLILFFLKGETVITGNYEGTEAQEHLICESNDTTYPLFNYDDSNSKSMKINTIFKNDELSSISLTYKLGYNSVEEIRQSEAFNHATLNTISQNEGLGPDAYNATYSKLKDGLQLSLYATSSDIDDKALKYFMLEDLNSKPYNQNEIINTYTKQGLKCTNAS